MAAFPTTGQYLDSIRSSSQSLRQAAQITIAPESIKRLLLAPAFTSSFKRVSAQHGLAVPLNFDSQSDELNYISVLSLLNFGSGYRTPLHAQTGRGAWDAIRALMFGLYISSSSDGNHLSAKGMQSISNAKIAELMGIDLHVERPHETLHGVTIGELGGPLYDLVTLITSTLNMTGSILVKLEYPNLGTFVLECLREGELKSSSDSGCDLDTVLERLVFALPALQDMALVKGKPIYCFKKALFLIHAISIRFGSISPRPFPIPSTTNSPVFTDNVLPSLLIHLGVIDVSSSPDLSSLFPGAGSDAVLEALLQPSPALDSSSSSNNSKADQPPPPEGPIVTSDQSFMLRAAAVDACELILKMARSLDSRDLVGSDGASLAWIRDITLPDLDLWLWAVAKDRPDYRALPRFAQRDTVFF